MISNGVCTPFMFQGKKREKKRMGTRKEVEKRASIDGRKIGGQIRGIGKKRSAEIGIRGQIKGGG